MNKISKSALLFSLLISAGVSFAADTYKNSILDMSMKKELNNTVSLTFYTSKPYNDNVFITKRNANTYVILFPETNSDIKKDISKAETEGLVQKVDVRTQPYNDQNGKGYTKIILTTPENTTVLAKTEVFKEAKPIQQVALEPAPVEKATQHVADAQNTQLPALPKKEVQKSTQKTEKVAQNTQKFDIIKPETISSQSTEKKAELPKVIQQEEQPIPQQEEVQEPENIVEEVNNQNEENNAVAEELPPPPQNEKKIVKSELTKFFETKVFWFSATGTLLILFLLIFLNARRKIKDIIGEDGISVNDEVSLKKVVEDIPATANKSDSADGETESKVNLYRLLNSSENAEQVEEVADTYSDDLAGMLNLANTDETTQENTEAFENADENDIVFDNMVIDEQVQAQENEPQAGFEDAETEFVLGDIVIDNNENEELTENELVDLSSQDTMENPMDEVTAEEITSPENSIDDYMKFLADNPEKLELSGNNAEIEPESEPELETEVFETANFVENEEQEINNENMFSEISDGLEVNEEISNFDDTVNDSDFEFSNEEMVFQPFDEGSNVSQTDFEQTDVNSLFEREDFANNLMQDNEEIIQQEQNTEPVEEQDYEEAFDDEPIISDENNVLDLSDYKQTVKIHDEVNNRDVIDEDISEQTEQNYTEDTIEEPEDNSVVLENGLKVISQVNLKKNAGLYMIDYEGKSSLIGFKNDNYYVLKNFEEMPKKELQARLYDKVGRKEQYLVKLGSEKMIVEFNQKEIKHVMDL